MLCGSGHVCQIQYSGSLLHVITGRNGVTIILSQSVSTLNEFHYQGYELKSNTQAEFDFTNRLTFALFPGTEGKALDIKEKDTKTAWIMI